MFEASLQCDILQKIILNTLLVSIPEEFFLVMFTLILVGEFEIWKEPECKKLIHKYDYERILIPTIVSALLSNVLRYSGLNYDATSVITILAVFILVIITNDIFGDASALKWIGKCFVFLILACIIVGISEFLYVPLVVYGTGKPIQEINQNIIVNFLVSLPSRMLQYIILIYLIYHKRTLLKGSIIKHILLFPVPLLITSLIVFFNLVFYIIAYNLIIYDRVLANLTNIIQVVVIVGVVLFPILNILGMAWLACYIKDREVNDRRIASTKLCDLLDKMELYSNSSNYGNIKWKLKEFGMGIEEVASSLYKENEATKKKFD